MDIKALFPNMSLIWTRWSAYDIVRWTDMGVEKEYIVPARGAEQITFDCTERTEAIVEDAIRMGACIFKGVPPVLMDSLYVGFAVSFGLLGQMVGTEPPLTADHNNMAPIYYPINSKQYGEEVSYFHNLFFKIYKHYASTCGYLPADSQTTPGPYGTLSYRVTPGQTPQIIWGVNSLEDVLQLSYSLMITSERPVLKICKNCGKTYYSDHPKSEFCGAKCRNQYNVRMFREREKSTLETE